jgi:hypothetical protein
VDCTSQTVTDAWEVGPSPSLSRIDEGRLLVRTGVYYDADYNIDLDGGISVLDINAGTQSEVLLSEELIGENIGDAVAIGDKALLLTSDAASVYTVWCYDMAEDTLVEAESTTSFLSGMSLNSHGEAWISARTSWADPDSQGGVMVYDVESCSSLTGPDWITTGIAPYDIAFY